MVFLSSVDSEPNLWQKLEDALGTIGNIQTLYSILVAITLIALFWISVVGFTKRVNAKSIKQVLKLVNSTVGTLKLGFDSCQSPAISKFCLDVAEESIEFCDSARFSMYIDCDLMAYPCSFGHSFSKFAVDLSRNTIKEAWESKEFEQFRRLQEKQRNGCTHRNCRPCVLGVLPNTCGQCIEKQIAKT